jgi:periplasmic copper chaperone A
MIARFLLLACLLAACGGGASAPLVAHDVRVTAARPGTSMSAGYLDLSNPGSEPVTITGVSSPEYARVDLHETVIENGVARMQGVGELVVEPGETLHFEPGARHLMLMQRRGDGQGVTLQFWSGDTLLLSVDASVGEDAR